MKKEKISLLTFFLLFALIVVIKYIITGTGIGCIIKKITGYYCPGCGITRMFISIIKLDFYQAFRYNPLVLSLLIIWIIYYIIKFIIKKINNKDIILPNYVLVIILVITIVFGILRNIPYFSYLLPTIVN